jgi:hypothetical protein
MSSAFTGGCNQPIAKLPRFTPEFVELPPLTQQRWGVITMGSREGYMADVVLSKYPTSSATRIGVAKEQKEMFPAVQLDVGLIHWLSKGPSSVPFKQCVQVLPAWRLVDKLYCPVDGVARSSQEGVLVVTICPRPTKLPQQQKCATSRIVTPIQATHTAILVCAAEC